MLLCSFMSAVGCHISLQVTPTFLLMLALISLQTLCTVVQHHMQLIRQLQQQMWACLGSAAQASSTAVLVGLQQQYMRTAGAMLSNAAPCSITGRQATVLQTSIPCKLMRPACLSANGGQQ